MRKHIAIAAALSTLTLANFSHATTDPETRANLAASKVILQQAPQQLSSPDEITSCLLPGKVRNLGNQIYRIGR